MKRKLLATLVAGAIFSTTIMFSGAAVREADVSDIISGCTDEQIRELERIMDFHEVLQEIGHFSETVEQVIRRTQNIESVTSVQVFLNHDYKMKGIQIFEGDVQEWMVVRVEYGEINWIEYLILYPIEEGNVTSENFDDDTSPNAPCTAPALADALAILRYIIDLPTEIEVTVETHDFDGNGVVEIADALVVLRLVIM
jgi:hypothetical protein